MSQEQKLSEKVEEVFTKEIDSLKVASRKIGSIFDRGDMESVKRICKYLESEGYDFEMTREIVRMYFKDTSKITDTLIKIDLFGLDYKVPKALKNVQLSQPTKTIGPYDKYNNLGGTNYKEGMTPAFKAKYYIDMIHYLNVDVDNRLKKLSNYFQPLYISNYINERKRDIVQYNDLDKNFIDPFIPVNRIPIPNNNKTIVL